MKSIISIIFFINFINATIIYIPTDYNTISAGVYNASPGDTVIVLPGVYYESVDIDGDLTLASMDILSPNSHYLETIIDGVGHGRVIDMIGGCGEVNIYGLTIRNGDGTGISTSTYTASCGDINIQNCVITGFGNTAIAMGDEDDNVYISNCIINNTKSTNDWGVVTVSSSNTNVEIDHTVIFSHLPNTPLGIRLTSGESTLTISNSIIWGFDESILATNGGVVSVSNSCIENGWLGTNVIESNPEFQHPAAGNFRLSMMSPCIGAGSEYDISSFDLDGNPRPLPAGSIKDMGAYEHYLDTPVLFHDGRTIYVSTDGSDVSGSGTSVDPFASIQKGIDLALNNDVVLVSPGTYHENIIIGDKDILVTSEYFSSIDTSTINATIIDGDSSGSVITILNQGDEAQFELRGLTIRNGEATYGGGIACFDSSPTLQDLNIESNKATTGGGGGMYLIQSSPNILTCKLQNNISEDVGGGLYAKDNSAAIIKKSVISNNSSNSTGAGIFTKNSSILRIIRSVVTNNTSSSYGGGIGIRESQLLIHNSLIANNSATTTAGGIYYYRNASPILVNSIVWGNMPNAIAISEYHNDYPSELTITYSNIEGDSAEIITYGNELNWLEGNINENPVYVDTINYQLSASSPCIDAGIMYTAIDSIVALVPPCYIAGNSPDMGPHEFNLVNNPPSSFGLLSPNNDSNIDTSQMQFTWNQSADCNQDIIRYSITIYSTSIDTNITNIVNNNVILNLENILTENTTYNWFVSAYDYIDTTTSNETFTFHYNPTVSMLNNDIPLTYNLALPYPNPANPSTMIEFTIPDDHFVSINIYNVLGKEVNRLVREEVTRGKYKVHWNGQDTQGNEVSSGIYFVMLKAGSFYQNKKIMIIK